MICACDEGTVYSLSRVNAGGFANPLCRNYSLHPAARGETPRPPAPGEQTKFRVWAHFLWLAVNDIAIACGYAPQTEWPKPGNARREPEELAIARTALDAADTDTRDEIRAQIEPDLRHVYCSSRQAAHRHPVSVYPVVGRGSQAHWDHVRAWQRCAEARRWNDTYRDQWLRGMRIVNGVPKYEAAGNDVTFPSTPQTDSQYYVVAVSGTSLKLDLPIERPRRRAHRDPASDRDAGRNFLLSKQRRQHRGAR